MFAHAYQSGYISLLYSVGNKPLQLWEKREETPGTSIRRVLDEHIQSSVIELTADNLVYTWIRCPVNYTADGCNSLHIRLRELVILWKNLEMDVSMEVHVMDAQQQLRRFRLSTFQKTTVIHPLITLLPLQLDPGWNQLRLNLAELTQQAYGTRYIHTACIQLHGNCRVRRIFFADQMFAEDKLPMEFRLFKRLTKEQARGLRERDKQKEEKCGENQHQHYPSQDG